MQWQIILVGCAIAFVAAALRRITGFGFAMVLVSLLSLFVAPTEAVLVTLILQLVLGIRNIGLVLRETDWSLLPWLIGAGLVATPVGLIVLHAMDERTLRLFIGGTVLLSLVPLLADGTPRLSPSPARSAVAGFLAGFFNCTAAMAAPPLLFYLVKLKSVSLEQRRATLITIFTMLTIASLASRAVTGRIDMPSVLLAALLCPASLAGDFVARRVALSLDHRNVNRMSVCIVAVTAIVMITSAF